MSKIDSKDATINLSPSMKAKVFSGEFYVVVDAKTGEIEATGGIDGVLPRIRLHLLDITDAGFIAKRCRVTVEVLES
jgi:hypothetical protein